jgi:integrase
MEIYKQGRSKYWIADFRVNGQRIRKSTKQTKRSAAQEAAMLMLREAQSDPVPAPVELKAIPTIEQFAEETFLPFLKNCTLDPDTVRWYKNGWRLLKATGYNVALDEVCSSDVDTLKVPGGPSNMNCMRRALRRMQTLALDKKVLSVRSKVPLVQENERSAVYSPELEKKILETAEQPLLDIFLLIFDGGIRPNESLHLQWPDLLWNKSLIHVRGTKSEKSDRHVPMSDRMRQMLRVRAQGETSPWVFPSPRKKGFPLSMGPVNKGFKKLREALDIPSDLVLYSGRHTFATDLLDATGNIKLVSETLGHASVATTERYTHPSKRGLAGIIDQRNATRAREGELQAEIADGHTFGHTWPIVQ